MDSKLRASILSTIAGILMGIGWWVYIGETADTDDKWTKDGGVLGSRQRSERLHLLCSMHSSLTFLWIQMDWTIPARRAKLASGCL